MYELFEHTADLGLRVSADSLEELFVDAARGLLAMLVADPKSVRPLTAKSISVSAEEPAFLLFDWLSELLYAFETDKLLLAEFELAIEGGKLAATCHGEAMDESRHRMEHEVKAITYHGLRLEQTASGWFAEVIVDI